MNRARYAHEAVMSLTVHEQASADRDAFPQQAEAKLLHLLDDTRRGLLGGDTFDAMERLDIELRRLRASSGGSAWRQRARALYVGHAARDLIMQEPVTRHAFEKPRGYSGDAELLDYIYMHRELPAATTALGRRIHCWGLRTPAQKSVRARAETLSAYIDRVCAACRKPAEILSVACGHLREAHRTSVVTQRAFHRYVAFDQ